MRPRIWSDRAGCQGRGKRGADARGVCEIRGVPARRVRGSQAGLRVTGLRPAAVRGTAVHGTASVQMTANVGTNPVSDVEWVCAAFRLTTEGSSGSQLERWRTQSQDHDCVAVGKGPCFQGNERCAGRHREALAQFRVVLQNIAIMSGVGDEKDHALDAHVPLLGSDTALEGLEVVETRFSLHDRGIGRSTKNHIRTALIARDRYRYFGAPTKQRGDAGIEIDR